MGFWPLILILQRIHTARWSSRDDFIQRRDLLAGAEFPGIFGIIVEVAGFEETVVIADQAIGSDLCRIEFDLQLDVFRNREKGAGELANQNALAFEDVVDVGIVAIAMIGKRFHFGILVVAAAETQNAEVNPRLTLLRDEGLQIFIARHAEVEVAVGGEQDPSVACSLEVLFGNFISHAQTRATGRATAGA